MSVLPRAPRARRLSVRCLARAPARCSASSSASSWSSCVASPSRRSSCHDHVPASVDRCPRRPDDAGCPPRAPPGCPAATHAHPFLGQRALLAPRGRGRCTPAPPAPSRPGSRRPSDDGGGAGWPWLRRVRRRCRSGRAGPESAARCVRARGGYWYRPPPLAHWWEKAVIAAAVYSPIPGSDRRASSPRGTTPAVLAHDDPRALLQPQRPSRVAEPVPRSAVPRRSVRRRGPTGAGQRSIHSSQRGSTRTTGVC